MKRSVYHILLIILSATAFRSVSAQPAECIVWKSFPADRLTELIISNKFGDITLINSNVDSVIICGTASVEYNDTEMARKGLDLIRLDISLLDNRISGITTFDQKFFSSAFSTGRKSFNVSYIIKSPAYINVMIENSFGNIEIEEITGKADLTISHGSINAVRLARGNEKPVNRVVVRHSKATVGNAGWLGMELYHSPMVSIGTAQALSAVSEFSAVTIGSVNSMVINSVSDKYKVESLARGVVEAQLSTIEISSLAELIRADASLSTIRIGRLEKGFGEVNMTGSSTVFALGVPRLTPYRLSAILRGAATIIVPPVDRELLSTESSVPGVYIVSGSGGGGTPAKSAINGDLNSGKLEIFHSK
jgi:hypothetical protein